VNAHRIEVGMREGKRPLRTLRRRYVDNIKMDLRDIRWNGMNCIDLAENREHGNEPSSSIESCGILVLLHNVRLVKKAQLHAVR
jgi:hypothetical protein